MSEYPKWRYKNGEGKLVNDAKEEKALGPGWGDSPDPKAATKKVETPKPEAPKVEEEEKPKP